MEGSVTAFAAQVQERLKALNARLAKLREEQATLDSNINATTAERDCYESIADGLDQVIRDDFREVPL